MESLRLLLVKNHSLLDRLRVRLSYSVSAVRMVESDTHKQYGPFAGFWDEWMIEAKEMEEILEEHVANTSLFLAELRDFIATLESKKRLLKSDVSYLREVTSLTTDKLTEQSDLLYELNERILLHKQVVRQLLLVEAIDSLEE